MCSALSWHAILQLGHGLLKISFKVFAWEGKMLSAPFLF